MRCDYVYDKKIILSNKENTQVIQSYEEQME